MDSNKVAAMTWPWISGVWLWRGGGSIAKEVTIRGIPTPRGKAVWSESTIRSILHNRVYAGVVEALKTEAVAPQQRQGAS